MVLFFSCEESLQELQTISLIDCNECTEDEPQEAFVILKLGDPYKLGSTNGRIYININEGNLEDSVLFRTIYTMDNEISVFLPVNKKFTITAQFSINNKTYITVNSITTRVKFNKTSCEQPCYYTTPRSVNLKLKYTR